MLVIIFQRYPTLALEVHSGDVDSGESVKATPRGAHSPNSKENTANFSVVARAPWCYTTDPRIEWEECGVPACAELCAVRQDKADYIGPYTPKYSLYLLNDIVK